MTLRTPILQTKLEGRVGLAKISPCVRHTMRRFFEQKTCSWKRLNHFVSPKCTFEAILQLRGQRVNCAKGKAETSVRKALSGNRGGFFDGRILVGILLVPITGNRLLFTVGTREPKHEPLRVFGCRAGGLF